MKGNNELRLCAAALTEVVQEWLDNNMPDEIADGITAINESGSMVFVIKLRPAAEVTS